MRLIVSTIDEIAVASEILAESSVSSLLSVAVKLVGFGGHAPALLPSQVAITPGLRKKALNANDLSGSVGAPLLTFDPKERQVWEGLNFDYKDYL